LATSSLGLAMDEHRLGRMQGVRPMRPSLFLRRELGHGAGPLGLIAACGAGLSGGGVRGTTRRCSGRGMRRRGAAEAWRSARRNDAGVRAKKEGATGVLTLERSGCGSGTARRRGAGRRRRRRRSVRAVWRGDVRCMRCCAAVRGGMVWGRCCARAGCAGGLCVNGTMAVRWLRRRAGGGGETAGATYGELQQLRVECGEGRGGACALRGACGRMAWRGRAEARSSWACAGSRRRALCADGDARCMRERGARACARWRRRGRGWMTTTSSLCMINAHHPRERREKRVARCLGQK